MRSNLLVLLTLLIVTFNLSACGPNSTHTLYTSKIKDIDLNPIEIQGVSFANTQEENWKIIKANFGCDFYNDGRTDYQPRCCLKPKVYNDGSKHYIYEDAIIGQNRLTFMCNVYSSCQFDISETKKY